MNYLKLRRALFLILIVGIGIAFGVFMEMKTYEKHTKIKKKPWTPCKLYGYQPINEEYYMYTVKKGDTLLSIAQKELKDSGKIYQIINLNKEEYPELINDNSIVRSGWELKIPLTDIGIIEHELKMLSGKIADYDGGKMGLVLNKESSHYYGLPINHDANIVNKDLKKDDCVNVLMDTDEIGNIRIIRISLQ